MASIGVHGEASTNINAHKKTHDNGATTTIDAFNTKANANAAASISRNGVNVDAQAKASGTVLKGSVQTDVGGVNVEGEGTILAGEAGAEFKVGTDVGVQAGLGAHASIYEAKGTVGDKDGSTIKASGCIGCFGAEGKVALGKPVYNDYGEVVDRTYGGCAKVGAVLVGGGGCIQVSRNDVKEGAKYVKDKASQSWDWTKNTVGSWFKFKRLLATFEDGPAVLWTGQSYKLHITFKRLNLLLLVNVTYRGRVPHLARARIGQKDPKSYDIQVLQGGTTPQHLFCTQCAALIDEGCSFNFERHSCVLKLVVQDSIEESESIGCLSSVDGLFDAWSMLGNNHSTKEAYVSLLKAYGPKLAPKCHFELSSLVECVLSYAEVEKKTEKCLQIPKPKRMSPQQALMRFKAVRKRGKILSQVRRRAALLMKPVLQIKQLATFNVAQKKSLPRNILFHRFRMMRKNAA